MKGIILAAGRGSRMLEYTSRGPKAILKKKNYKIIDKLIRNFKLNNISNISIVTGYKREVFKDRSLRKFHNKIWNKSNMLYSLLSADRWLSNNDCLITYSDIIYNKNAILKLKQSSEFDISIIFDPSWLGLWKKRFLDPLKDAEIFESDKNGFLKQIGGKASSFSQIKGQYMGLLRINSKAWKKIKEFIINENLDVYKLDMTGLLSKIVYKNYLKIKCIKYSGNWCEVDSKKDFVLYNNLNI